MSLIWHIWAALGLDALLGDPRRWPHPVRVIGALALRLEPCLRRHITSARLAGWATALLVTGGTALATWVCLTLAGLVAIRLQTVLSIFFLYTTLALRDMQRHALAVLDALRQDDLELARRKVALIVGRDTAGLDRSGVIRAAVESVAESTIDGVIAPLFFAFLGGPTAAMAYKAVSTLDSTFGYRNARYIHFGWAAARIDDVANYLPARIGAILLALAARVLGENSRAALKAALRDSGRHNSPNAGWGEAAMAGALGVQLGGPVQRGGEPGSMPYMGEAVEPLAPDHIRRAGRLMVGTAGAAVVVFSLVRLICSL